MAFYVGIFTPLQVECLSTDLIVCHTAGPNKVPVVKVSEAWSDPACDHLVNPTVILRSHENRYRRFQRLQGARLVHRTIPLNSVRSPLVRSLVPLRKVFKMLTPAIVRCCEGLGFTEVPLSLVGIYMVRI